MKPTVARPGPSAEQSDDADIEDFVTALLGASRVLVGVSARSLGTVEETVTLTQFRTLVVLDGHGEMNLQGLAERLGVNSSTAMRMIDRLIAAQLVTRHDNPANRREVILQPTAAGTRLVRRVTRRRRAAIREIVAAMPQRPRSQLVTALRSFAVAAGEHGARPEDAASLGW